MLFIAGKTMVFPPVFHFVLCRIMMLIIIPDNGIRDPDWELPALFSMCLSTYLPLR